MHPAHEEIQASRLERAAQFLGTPRYLAWQTAFMVAWIVLNMLVFTRALRWDPYPFILLNLCLSTQASYAAPILQLAANHKDELDRARDEHDHELLRQIAEHLGIEVE